jgi:hypothetical protein
MNKRWDACRDSIWLLDAVPTSRLGRMLQMLKSKCGENVEKRWGYDEWLRFRLYEPADCIINAQHLNLVEND